jgi:hypothetical protein
MLDVVLPGILDLLADAIAVAALLGENGAAEEQPQDENAE